MAQTAAITLNTDYQLVVSSTEDYAIQNVGSNQIEFLFKDTVPLVSDKGHVIRPYDGAITGWGDGDIYARVKNGTGLLAVTK